MRHDSPYGYPPHRIEDDQMVPYVGCGRGAGLSKAPSVASPRSAWPLILRNKASDTQKILMFRK